MGTLMNGLALDISYITVEFFFIVTQLIHHLIMYLSFIAGQTTKAVIF